MSVGASVADTDPVEFYVERVANMSHANGVFRVTFAQQAEGDAIRPMVRLLIPANQLASILQGINNAARDIGERQGPLQEITPRTFSSAFPHRVAEPRQVRIEQVFHHRALARMDIGDHAHAWEQVVAQMLVLEVA